MRNGVCLCSANAAGGGFGAGVADAADDSGKIICQYISDVALACILCSNDIVTFMRCCRSKQTTACVSCVCQLLGVQPKP